MQFLFFNYWLSYKFILYLSIIVYLNFDCWLVINLILQLLTKLQKFTGLSLTDPKKKKKKFCGGAAISILSFQCGDGGDRATRAWAPRVKVNRCQITAVLGHHPTKAITFASNSTFARLNKPRTFMVMICHTSPSFWVHYLTISALYSSKFQFVSTTKLSIGDMMITFGIWGYILYMFDREVLSYNLLGRILVKLSI